MAEHTSYRSSNRGVVTYNFYEKKGIDLDKHPNYKDKDKLEPFDVCYAKDLPQQPSGSLDCGLYMVTYPECLTYVEEDDAQNDDEAPMRPVGETRIAEDTEVLEV
ncbi:hypothetical protein BC332_18910 [Capsicum chinense]|nr:hypothetical protein BC332_18910 [Capsicum chinense]